jgi:hypothetical protein
MSATLLLMLATLGADDKPVDTLFMQVAPKTRPAGEWERPEGQKRAVVLIQGLQVHPFSKAKVERASLRDWQQQGSPLLKHLEPIADVYSFAYGQTVAVDEIADHEVLRKGVRHLREMGYREIVIVGFSAGGVVARRLIEDDPECGATKVVQVCAPNAGSGWAKMGGVRSNQAPFLHSLTKEDRRSELKSRLDVEIPADVEFVCIVGTGVITGDGVVAAKSQWTPDLQAQGIPATTVATDHLSAVRTSAGAEKIAEVIRLSQPRWTAAQVAEGRKKILHD